MRLWLSRYGNQIYELNYEKLTIEQEFETKRLIKEIGLQWERACLFPERNKRVVNTTSQEQVTKKIYQGSSGAWRKYEPYLNGAFDSLPSL